MSDTFSSGEVLASSSLILAPATTLVPSSLHQAVVHPLALGNELSVDHSHEESVDDPGFASQGTSINPSLPCDGKRPVQCVVQPFTTLPEMDQRHIHSLIPEAHFSHHQLIPVSKETPVLHPTKSQSSFDAAPVTLTPSRSLCIGGVLATFDTSHALPLESSDSSVPTINEPPSDSTATTCLFHGAATVDGIADAARTGDENTVTVNGAQGKKFKKTLHCRTCRQLFPSRESLQQHQTEAHNKGRPFECGECGRHFLSSHNLSTHRRHRHPGTAAASSAALRCGECGKCFSSKANLALHSKLHSGERPFLCTVCGARFSRKCTLESHLTYHTGDRRFTCDRCGARFYTSHSLARHAKLHTGDRSFVCEVCGASYVTNSDLKRHQLSHGPVKPFACSSCTKTFARKHDLKVHERYHSGEFRHECPHCGKRFVEQSNYRRHLRQHTGEKPYRCQACPLHFAQLHHLKKHLLSCPGTTEGVATAATIPSTAGPRTTRVGHLQKMSGG